MAGSLQADAVAVAVLLAVLDLARIPMEALVAEAHPIAANTVVRASFRARGKRTIVPAEPILAGASIIPHTFTVPRARIGTAPDGAVVPAETRLAPASTVVAPPIAQAVARAACKVALSARIAREAVARAIVAVAVARAIRFASNQRAVEAREPLIALTDVRHALALSVAVVGASRSSTVFTRVTRDAFADPIVAVSMASAVVGARLEAA